MNYATISILGRTVIVIDYYPSQAISLKPEVMQSYRLYRRMHSVEVPFVSIRDDSTVTGNV